MSRQFLREYFSFTRSQRNGTMLLSFLILVLFMAPYIYDLLSKKADYEVDPVLLNEIRLFYGIYDTILLFPANNLEGQWTEPSEDITAGAAKLTDKTDAGSFKTALAATGGGAIKCDPDPIHKIDLNSADTIDLMKIRGIGQVLSRRILRYRGILGGYARIEQLREIYGIDEDRYEGIVSSLFADSTLIIHLLPLSDDFSTLLRHPYLNFDQVSYISRLRENNKLNSLDDLLHSPVFTEQDISRLRPYLDFK